MLLRPPFVALAVAQASCGAPAPSSPAPSPRASVHIPAPVAAPPLPASSTPPSPDRPHLEVVVPSTNCEWTTASTFEAGQLLHIQARGTWQVCREHCVAALQNQPVGPQGFAAHPTTVDDPVADSTGTMTVGGFLVSNVARGALLGQLGDQAAFAVGPSWTVKLTEASPLAFSINDNDCRDNRGTMTVRITAYDDPAELRLSLAERQRVLQRAITLGQAIDEQAVAGSPYFSLQYYLSSQPDLAEARTAAGIRLTFLHAIHGGTPSWDLTLDSQGTIQGRSTSGYDDLARQLGLDPSGQPSPLSRPRLPVPTDLPCQPTREPTCEPARGPTCELTSNNKPAHRGTAPTVSGQLAQDPTAQTIEFTSTLGLARFLLCHELSANASYRHHGEVRDDRTGTGTISVFGAQARYDLRDGFPLLTVA